MTSLYNKIVIRVILIVSLTIMAVSAVSIWAIRTRILPDIQKLTMDGMASKVNEIDLWINYNIQSIVQLAQGLENTTISEENSSDILAKLVKYKNSSKTHYESLGFITPNGKKHVTDGTTFDVTEREYFSRLKQEKVQTVISKNLISLSNNKHIVLIVTKIMDESGELKGYISGALTVDYVKEVVKRTDLYGFNAYIINKSNRVIIGEAKAKKSDKNTILFLSEITSNPDWSLVTEIPKNFVQKEIMFTAFWIAVLGVVIFIISSLFVRKFAQIIATPVNELECAMTKAKSGNLVRIVPDKKITEFANLGDRYNDMLENIEQLMEEIRVKERLKNEADNKAMYSQIKPHFLYNTLETIQAMAFDNEDEQVEIAIGNLATLFRIGLSNDKQIITLEEELRHVKSYLSIQLLRYSDLFEYTLEIDNVDLNQRFMKFTLQPIVENAIYHGIKKLSYKGKISIRIMSKCNHIDIVVSNTCNEIDTKKIATINEKLKTNHIPEDIKGYGLFNVNSRLKLNFGDEYGIKLYAKNQTFTSEIIHPVLDYF